MTTDIPVGYAPAEQRSGEAPVTSPFFHSSTILDPVRVSADGIGMAQERNHTRYAAAAIAAGLFFILGSLVTTSNLNTRVILGAVLATFALGGTYALLLVRRSQRMERANEQLASDFRDAVVREADLRTQVGYLLREPLASVVADADLLLSRPQTPGDQQRVLLTSIRTNAREVEEMLDDLSRAGAGDTPSPDIASVVILDEELLSVASADPRTKSIHIDCEPSRAWGDPARVRQVLRTLVTLSTQYGGAQITVQTAQRGHVATATVSGKGAILPGHALAALSDGADADSEPEDSDGSFEALRAARRMTERMGGTISSLYAFGESHIVLTLPAPSPMSLSTDDRSSASA